jgi:hypothetical protein
MGLWRRSVPYFHLRDQRKRSVVAYPFPRAVVPDGYGLSYSIGDDYIRWTTTSLKLGTDEFNRCLAEAATETRQMMERAKRMEGTKTKL